ncbi:N-formylglutamate amidohydrolase [Amaricoccus solimangrovi]|uniref:N-formylglutamate amidohydrolase n=1 Tax=Amaricoccus solimangrovi TaxID=2589815 RepID=A0A501WIM8_9RHOB|nr:N-formylglutamate amidohydrolase [Amaricoccus solimangrovi]TPE47964.1 N-formylglutamate amidohydrolase [Amaricoccus solimangrovi]
MDELVYQLREPEEYTSCAVFNSPHSGSAYPLALLGATLLDPVRLRSSEDAFVDELFRSAPRHGAPLMAATMPRAFLDLNRASDDLDPALIAGASRRVLNPRIAAGLGVIPRVVAEGRPIIHGKLPLAEAQRRIATYWHPYHDRLRALIEDQKARFGMAILFDCHSMPSDALNSALNLGQKRRPNLVLGDRFGASCDRWLVDAATEIFTEAGFSVVRNAPFAGGYITQHYGRPAHGVQALQIEIDRSLYMEERTIIRSRDFVAIAEAIGGAVRALTALGPRRMKVAAE